MSTQLNNNKNSNIPAPSNKKKMKEGKCNLKGSQKLRPNRIGKGVRRALIVENIQNCFPRRERDLRIEEMKKHF